MKLHLLKWKHSKDGGRAKRKKIVPNVVDEDHVVDPIEAIVNQNDRVFFNEARIKAIHHAQKKGRIDALRMAVGLDADIEKPMAPEEAFEAKPKKDDWWAPF